MHTVRKKREISAQTLPISRGQILGSLFLPLASFPLVDAYTSWPDGEGVHIKPYAWTVMTQT